MRPARSENVAWVGGIYNASRAEVAIIDSVISGNSADEGGGIYNAGSMQIERTTISDNLVGGAFSQQPSFGGGICNSGTLDIVNSTITANTASGSLQSGGIGGGIFRSEERRVGKEGRYRWRRGE